MLKVKRDNSHMNNDRTITKKQFKTNYSAIRLLFGGMHRYRRHQKNFPSAKKFVFDMVTQMHPCYYLAFIPRIKSKYKLVPKDIAGNKWKIKSNSKY